MTVAAILKHKGSEVVHVAPEATVAQVIGTLCDRGIGAVLVLGAGRELLGIVSERDIVRCLGRDGAAALDRTAEALMTRKLVTATPRTTAGEAMAMMTEGRFRHLPVLDGGRLAGMISIGDVVKARISQQEQEVDSLKAYVAGAA